MIWILRDAMDTVRPAADAKEITLDLTVSGEPPRAERRRRAAAPGVLEPALERRQVHAASGPVLARIDRLDSQIRVTISDGGVGIARVPALRSALPPGRPGFTRPHGGLGLGLAIVKHLVQTPRRRGVGGQRGAGDRDHVHGAAADRRRAGARRRRAGIGRGDERGRREIGNACSAGPC